MFRIAMISRWHPHARENRYVKQLENIPETQITCVWDSDEKRGKEWAEELHADFEADLDTLLQRKDVDGICITAPTDQHREIILKAAKAGKHVFTEKALAMDGREAQEVRKAVKESGIELGVVFPRRANREYFYAKKLIEEGRFGTISLIRVRNAVTVNAVFEDHWFKEEPIGGGGALRDLGCHNIDLACWLLGEPDSVSVCRGFTRGFAVDDTYACSLKFKNGAIAMLDSTFSAPLCGNWYSLEIYGTEMAFLADTENVTIIRRSNEAEKEIVKINDLPAGYPLPIKQWVDACTKGAENICNVDAGVLVNQVLDAAVLAAEQERTVKIKEVL